MVDEVKVYFYVSDLMGRFLAARYAAKQEDKDIAYRITNAYQVGVNAPNYLDLIWDDGKAVITYTSHQKFMDARDKARQAGGELPEAYDRKGHRTKTRPARIVKHFINKEDGRANDVFAQSAQAYMQAQQDRTNRIDILRGALIGKWYDRRLYCSCEQTGIHGSCMNKVGYNKGGRFDLYMDNAEMAVVICEKCGGLEARAILWTDRDTSIKYVDRIYGNALNERMYQAWATENGHHTIWRNQRQGESLVDERGNYPRFAIKKDARYTWDGWHPYLDSTHHCAHCDHLGLTDKDRRPLPHLCAPHAHIIVRPEMVWEKDRPLPPINHGTCPYCNTQRFEDDDDDIICDHWEWCDFCEDRHCEEYQCHRECEHCGTPYGIYDNCPNMGTCDNCDNWYCRGVHGENHCPSAEACEHCEEMVCGTCEDCNTYCQRCGEWYYEETELGNCPHCVIACVVCDNEPYRDSVINNNGRCTICHVVMDNMGHVSWVDAWMMRAKVSKRLFRNVIDECRYDGNSYEKRIALSNLYHELDGWWKGSERYARYFETQMGAIIDRYGIAPYTVTLPLDVVAEMWLENEGDAYENG